MRNDCSRSTSAGTAGRKSDDRFGKSNPIVCFFDWPIITHLKEQLRMRRKGTVTFAAKNYRDEEDMREGVRKPSGGDGACWVSLTQRT